MQMHGIDGCGGQVIFGAVMSHMEIEVITDFHLKVDIAAFIQKPQAGFLEKLGFYCQA